MKPTLRSLCGLAAAFTLVGPGFSTALGQAAHPPAAAPSVDSLGAEFGGYRADTRPSRDSTLSYTFPVEIAKILVKGGQKVKLGEALVQGKDDEARFQRDYQKSIADSDLDVQKAQVAMEEAQVEFDGQVKLRDVKKAGQEIEYERAKATLDARKVDFEIAKLQYIQQKIKLNVNQAQLDRFQLAAPFDGVIDKVDTDVGEVKRETEGVLRIVSIDPLRIDVSTPTGKTLEWGLKTGDPAWVFLDVPGEPAVYEGKIVELAAHADFGANERRVRVELPNPREWPAGLAAWVRFTPPEGDWAKRVVKSEPKRAGATPALNLWQLLAPPGGERTELIGDLRGPTAPALLVGRLAGKAN
jgi:RND family efflux transporter MFP subunit